MTETDASTRACRARGLLLLRAGTAIDTCQRSILLTSNLRN
jgi:hypothetical protein